MIVSAKVAHPNTVRTVVKKARLNYKQSIEKNSFPAQEYPDTIHRHYVRQSNVNTCDKRLYLIHTQKVKNCRNCFIVSEDSVICPDSENQS